MMNYIANNDYIFVMERRAHAHIAHEQICNDGYILIARFATASAASFMASLRVGWA
jgi:hypothetical protein